MRACQVCGFSSWGPLKSVSELQRLAEFDPKPDVFAWVRCDNCKSIAQVGWVQESAPSTPATPPDAGFPGIMSNLLNLVPTAPLPPSRTERLIHTLLRSSMWTRKDTVTDVVVAARALETALDAPPASIAGKESEKYWLVLSFPAREEFERWFTGLLDAVNQADHIGFTTQDYPPKWYDAAVAYAEDKRRGK